MNAKELMIPRFEVIETYPKSKFAKGDILERIPNATNDWYNVDKSLINADILLEEIEQYPHLFKKLNWWERRKIEDMPKRLICKAIPNDTEIMEIQEWDMEILVGWINKKERSCCSLRTFNPEYGYFPVD
jgi:hypothetical protein